MYISLEEIGIVDRSVVGIKAYNCSVLRSLNVNSKTGFVIYGVMTKEDRDKLRRNADANKLYAVRSSMEDEDCEKYSSAGKYDTILAVRGEELIENIQMVLESKSVGNRAVFVQEMVLSEAAGVIFTNNPVNGDEEIIIEACLGAGENVVSGRMDPDVYVVRGEKITKKIAVKNMAFSYGYVTIPGEHLNFNGWDVRTVISKDYKTLHSIFYPERRKEVLTNKQLTEMCLFIQELKKRFGDKLDIEFAVEKNMIYILQVRKITSIENIKKERNDLMLQKKQHVIFGQCVAKGSFTGRTVCVDLENDLQIYEQITECDKKVLVVYELVPELIYGLKGIGAIVTAKGGILSHGAIVAREKGIPCVTNIGEKIFDFVDNMEVTVDGSEGSITFNDKNK